VLVGIAMVVGGLIALYSGITSLSSTIVSCETGDCAPGAGPGAFVLLFPVGLVLVILGGIVWSASAGSLQARQSSSPLSAVGYFGVLGIVFFGVGAAMWLADQQPNADHTTNVLTILGLIFAFVGLLLIGAEVASNISARRSARILASGIHGRATVLAVRDSNVTVNNNPMIALDLRVEIPGQRAFTRTVHQVISRLQVGEYRRGMVLAVAADPANPRNVVVDWDSSPIDGVPTDAVTGQPVAASPTAQVSTAELAKALRVAADQLESGQGSTGQPMTPDELATVLRRASRAAARAADATPAAPATASAAALPTAPAGSSGMPSMPAMPMISTPTPPQEPGAH
jgi:hypothetical protein